VLKNLDLLFNAEVPRASLAPQDIPLNPAVQERGERA
jgi:hypothetical protein